MSYRRNPKSSYYVYFARAGDMMKIGCSVQPVERLKQIAEWVPFKTKLVAVYPGAFDLEADLHAFFADSWSHLEWFHVTPAMERLIDQINAGEKIAVPKLPRDHAKELAKTEKKRASRRITMAESKGPIGDLSYPEREAARPQYLTDAITSFAGAQNGPPTDKALAAIARYERELAVAA